MPQLPPLNAVRIFEAVIRHGSLTKAAAELNMSQSAVSYQVKRLEDFAGSPLLRREARGVSLTTRGSQLAPVIRRSLADLETAFRRQRSGAEKILAITTFQTIANVWLAPRIGSFQIAHPDIAVRIELSAQLVDLSSSEFDVAIRSGKGGWEGLASDFLFAQSFTAVASPLYIERHGRPAHPVELLTSRHTLIAPSDDWWPLWFAKAGVPAATLQQDQGIDVEYQHTAALVSASGHGVALVTPSLHREELAAGRLIQLFDVIADAGASYWLVYRPELARLHKLRAFRDWALREAGATSGDPAN
jgi:LysR family glycine cleavage system transcriptional activator